MNFLYELRSRTFNICILCVFLRKNEVIIQLRHFNKFHITQHMLSKFMILRSGRITVLFGTFPDIQQPYDQQITNEIRRLRETRNYRSRDYRGLNFPELSIPKGRVLGVQAAPQLHSVGVKQQTGRISDQRAGVSVGDQP